jgi:lysophospholipase L1-like esterase
MDNDKLKDGKKRIPPRGWAARTGLILFGLVLACVMLEFALNLGALFVHAGPISISEERGTILALGDSHTYGVFTQPEEAYPGQLQVLLDERAPGSYNVVNLGLPGMNSSEIAARLPEWITRFRPFAVIVSVGVNNRWNWSDTWEAGRFGTVWRWVADLRLTRLYHLISVNLRNNFFPPERAERPEIMTTQFAGEDARVEHRDARTGELLISHVGAPHKGTHATPALRKLRQELEKMRLITEQRHVQLVLLTYSAFNTPGLPSDFKVPTLMSQEMREFGALYDLPLIDTHDRFAELLAPGVPRAKYFASELDDHPNPAGHAEIAAILAEAFEPR